MNDRVPVYFYNPGQRIPSYARGGLHEHARELARQGRNGDNMVVHMSKDEFNAFRSKYGDPTINPKTGLPEYWSLRDFIAPAASIIAPLALGSVFPTYAADLAGYFGGAPGLETAISGLGGAGVGALASSLMGGKALPGAVLGGLTGAIMPNWGDITTGIKGLLPTAAATAAATPAPGLAVAPPAAPGLWSGFEELGEPLPPLLKAAELPAPIDEINTGGYPISTIPIRIEEPPLPGKGIAESWPARDAAWKAAKEKEALEAAAKRQKLWDQWKWPALAGGALMAAQYANRPKAVPKTGGAIVPYSKSRNEPLQNITLARNYQLPSNLGTFGQRTRGPNDRFFNDQFTVAAARGGEIEGGGPLSMMSAMHDGPGYVGSKEPNGDGRSDGVEARLSNKEYVVDAESMALLGNGDPDAGAKKMDEFRKNLRRQKGKALAKGKFSPDAKKSPLSYLSGGG